MFKVYGEYEISRTEPSLKKKSRLGPYRIVPMLVNISLSIRDRKSGFLQK